MLTCKAGKRASEKRREIGLVDLPEEFLLTITVDGRSLGRLSCSPFGRRELVLGWLFCQDVIGAAADVVSLRLQGERALVRLRAGALARFNPVQVTACSGGGVRQDLFAAIPAAPRRARRFTLARARALMERLPAQAKWFRKHGGIHCSLLADMKTSRILASREDIGRSNSIDKVIGWGLAAEIDFGRTVVLTTGRISAEMALKCLHAGIPVLVSQTTLTSKALEIVRCSGLTLIGHVLKPRPIILNL